MAPHDLAQAGASELLTFPCGQCGADLQFEAGTNAMTCPYCGHIESIEAPLAAGISSYRYHDEVFRALVNARTGEVVGERPWSWVKITLAVVAVAAVIVAVVLFAKYR